MRFPTLLLTPILALALGCTPEPSTHTAASPARTLTQGNLTLTVDPAAGGRIQSLTFHGRELLAQASAKDRANWGSTLWVSPQQHWGWPPPDSFDNLPYQLAQTGTTQLHLSGPVDTEKTGLRLHKSLALTGADRVQLDYRLENPGDTSATAAAWEVTRVPIEGLVVFAREADPLWWSFGSFAVEQFGDLVWLDASGPLSEGKLNANGRGWLAWVTGRQMYIKRFSDLSADQQAPKEAEVQVYVSPRGYMELEAQGAYQTIAAGESVHFQTEWQLVTLPADVEVGVDSPSLQTLLQSLGLSL